MYIKKIIALMFCCVFIFTVSCSNIDRLDDSAIEKAFASAKEAKIIWFEIDNMPHDSDIYHEISDGIRYYKVTHSEIKTMAELRDYLETLFSDSFVNKLLSNNKYMDIDGELYVLGTAGATDPSKGKETHEIIRKNNKKIIYRITVEDINLDDGSVIGHTVTDMVYEFIDNKWIFTAFDRVR